MYIMKFIYLFYEVPNLILNLFKRLSTIYSLKEEKMNLIV